MTLLRALAIVAVLTAPIAALALGGVAPSAPPLGDPASWLAQATPAPATSAPAAPGQRMISTGQGGSAAPPDDTPVVATGAKPQPAAAPSADAPPAAAARAAEDAAAAPQTAAAAAAAVRTPPTEAELSEAMRIAVSANPEAGAAAAEAARERLRAWEQVAARGSDAIAAGRASTAALEVLRETLSSQRAAARALAERARAAAQPLRQQLDALGAAPPDGAAEPHAVAVERKAIAALIGGLDARARQSDLAATRADGLITDIDALIRQRFAEQLLTRGPSPLDPSDWPVAASELAGATVRLGEEVIAAVADPVRQREREERLPLLAAAVAVALLLGLWLRKRLIVGLVRAAPESAGRGRRVAVGAMIAATRLLLPTASAAVVYFGLDYSGVLGADGSDLLDLAATGVMLLIAGQGIAWAYYSPSNSRFRLSRLDDAKSRQAVLLAVMLGVVLCVDKVLVQGGEELGFLADSLAVLNLAVLTAGGVVMWGLAGLVRPPRMTRAAVKAAADDIAAYAPVADDEDDAVGIGRTLMAMGAVAMRLVAVASVLLSAAGYYAASRYAFFPTAMTLGLLAAGVLLFTMIREGVDAYLSDETEAAGRGAGAPGKLRLLPILAGFIIVLVLIPELALIWGARTADLAEGWSMISGGLKMGDVTLSPVDFLTFALVFTGVYTVSRLFQTILRKSVLPNTSLDSGARNAVASFVGYAGFAIAAIAAVSAAGLDLSSLAIVAGALSVGIGFGLQNVVNNFVSGIILLVERPIKVGDWINVNGTHGTVRKISVRATEIETFDRASLIVPNGDLISSPVMNMTHGNNVGRVIVPVGVAYGTDVERVREILSEVSTSHPAALRYPAPQVLFMAFGADSMNFEIRAILRDVGQTLAVQSHMHFEIERRFREAGIEIPFAQRDIHLRNPEALGAAIAAAMAAGGLPGPAAPPATPAAPAAPAPPRSAATPVGAPLEPDTDGDAAR
jgi:potassium efflux system protein